MIRRALVTVGIPVYNEADFLKETIESVLAQTYKDIVVLISDNGSTDNSPAIIKDMATQDERIVYYRQPEVLSPIENFKFLRDTADTRYFMWLGGHDQLTPSFIEEAVNAMEANSGCSLFYPRTIRVDRDNNRLPILDFDIDTLDLGFYDRIMKVFQNLVSSSLLHGLFRLEQLKLIPLTKDGSEEYLVFLKSAVNGSFIPSMEPGLLRREIREPEDAVEIEKRYKRYGFLYTDEYSYFEFIAFTLIENIFSIWQLSFMQQIKLVSGVKFFFIDKISPLSYNRIIYYFLTKKFKPKVALGCLLKKVDIFIKS